MSTEHLHPFGENKLLMGLQWQPVVGQVTLQHAKLLAKQQRAKQWVLAGQSFFAVGVSYRQKIVKEKVYAAAVCYALLYPKGGHATIYKVKEDLYWLAAVHEGTPISLGDKLFTELTQAQVALSQLVAQQPDLKIESSPVVITDFSALISTHPLQKARLQSIRIKAWRFMYAVILLLAIWGGWQFESPPVEAALVTPEVDPYLALWEHKKIKLNGKDAVVQLFASFLEIPLVLKGWQFQEAICDASVQQWLCVYEYKATVDAVTTLELEQVLPEGWRNKSVNLQHVWFQHSVHFMRRATSSWLSAEQMRLQVLSQLQPIRPAFNSLRLAEPALLFPRLAGSPTYSPIFSQELYFDGPLRSLVLIKDFDQVLQWQRAVLRYKPQVEASLKSSALHVKLHGEIYVRD